MTTTQHIDGKIQRIVSDKGFFFIRTPDGRDWFGHRTELRDGWTFQDIREGMIVSFLPVPAAPKGPRATEIYVMGPS